MTRAVDRPLPHNLEAERAVLGAVLLNNEAYAVAAKRIGAQDFYRLAHRKVFEKMGRLAARGAVIDLVTLKEELGAVDLDDVGGPAFIAGLIDGVPRSSNVEHYAGIVKAKATIRRVLLATQKIQQVAHDTQPEDAQSLVSLASTEIDSLITTEPRPRVALPAFQTLREKLAMPRAHTRWRIDRVQPAGSRVLLAAAFKAGKTTLLTSLVGALADGGRFLGEFPARSVDGTVAVLDFEMSESQLVDWYRDSRIQHDDKVLLIPMRGHISAFNIFNAEIRSAWAAAFKERAVEYPIIDCLRPLLDAFGLDEHKDAGRALVAIDALFAEAGIADGLVVHHMGHMGERSRGDSRLRDWPDAEWSLVRKSEDPASARFFRAYGRDVDVPEGQLGFDADTRRLTLLGGSREDAKTNAAVADILELLQNGNQALSGRAIKVALADSHPRAALEAALRTGVQNGALKVSDGAHNARLYTASVPVSRSVPSASQDAASVCPAAFIERDTRTLETSRECPDVDRF